MTPQDVITEARRLIQDTDSSRERYSDTVLLGFVNQIHKRMVQYRPDLFITTENIAVTADSPDQSLPTGGVRLLEIFGVVGGDAIQEVDRQTLDRMYPDWRSEASGTPLNWMRHQRHPWKYHLTPPPSSGITLVAEYVKSPSDFAINDTLDLPDAYMGALIDGTVYLAEAIDAEHVGNGRAQFFFNSFLQALGVDLSHRVVVDAEDGAVGREQQQPRRGQQGGR